MKLVKISFIVAVAVMAIIGVSTTSYAFHGGGVANCESCHTMHNTLTGKAMAGQGSNTLGPAGSGDPTASMMFLLRGSDQSSTCLNCHENAGDTGPSSYHVSTTQATIDASANKAPLQRGPGGDFGWLKTATTTNTTDMGVQKQRHGHNVIAADFGYAVDPDNAVAPGGTFDALQLNCISCHNPHNTLRRTDETGTLVKPALGSNVYAIAGSGSSSNSAAATATTPMGPYRFLRGAGADQVAASYASFVFTANPPDATATNTYNRSEAAADTHVAYGQGMSAWCGNCHAAMDYEAAGTMGTPGHPHPNNVALGATIAAYYNAYKGSGDLSGTNGYSSLVPVEMGTNDYALLKAAASSSNGGSYLAADANAKVMCLSCHRAHATGFPSMLRFNVAGSTTDATGAYVKQSGQVAGQVEAAYYERPSTQFNANTKQLCNKCHAKD